MPLPPQTFGISTPLAIVLFILAFALYFVPTMIAGKRDHPNAVAIMALNILLGWTYVGGALAIVWALTDDTR